MLVRNRFVVAQFLLVGFLSILWMSGYAQTIDTSPATVDKVQALITQLKGGSETITEINVHAPDADGKMVKIASTTPGATGEPSDPEDIAAVEDNVKRIKRDGEAIDITVPLKDNSGTPVAAAGITIDNGGKVTSAKKEAFAVAGQIEQTLVSAR